MTSSYTPTPPTNSLASDAPLKISVVLFNLGGPHDAASVQPFLFNLFNDPAIIQLPAFIRTPLAALISTLRAKKAQANYALMGPATNPNCPGGSPLLPNTVAQATALQSALQAASPAPRQWQVVVAMRYWHPFTAAALQQVQHFAPDRIILLPLYPQFSTTTTGSSLRQWQQAQAKDAKLAKVPTDLICCYPTAHGFLATQQAALQQAITQAAAHGRPQVVFSAHGLPEKIVRAGDPYQVQCEATVAALQQALQTTLGDVADYQLAYQSRVGPLKWLGPDTESVIEAAAHTKRPLVVVPIAFVSEHIETLVELDQEYAEIAHNQGAPFYVRVPTVSTAPLFIENLANMLQARLPRAASTGPGDAFGGCGRSNCVCPNANLCRAAA